MTKSLHNKIAKKLAKKFGTKYKSDEGIDIVDRKRRRVIEVEVREESLSQGMDQVIRSVMARYLAVPKKLIKKAKEVTKGTGVGVMNESGRIIKKASRKKKK